MAIRRSDRERQRRSFLHALAAGRSVSEAAGHAGIPWSTLYDWRHDSTTFAAAWDRAAARAQTALVDRMRSALIQRAVDGVDEPVFHAGRLVGTRKRYSDALLLAGLREMKPAAPRAVASSPPRPRVIIEQFGPPTDKELRALGRRPEAGQDPAPAAAMADTSLPDDTPDTAAPAAPPDPAAPALRWDHLTQREGDGAW